MANDIDLLALNAAISINSLIDFTPSGSKRTASIQLDVIQAIRTALLARGIDPNEPLPPAESVAQGGEGPMKAIADALRNGTFNGTSEKMVPESERPTQADIERLVMNPPTPATGSGGEEHADAETIRSYAKVLDGMALCKPRTAEQFNLTTSAGLLRAYADSLKAHPAPAGGDAVGTTSNMIEQLAAQGVAVEFYGKLNHGGDPDGWLVALRSDSGDGQEYEGKTVNDALIAALTAKPGAEG